VIFSLAIFAGCSRNRDYLTKFNVQFVKTTTILRCPDLILTAAVVCHTKVALCFLKEGKIERIFVKPYDVVQRGQVLAVLNDSKDRARHDKLCKKIRRWEEKFSTFLDGNNESLREKYRLAILEIQQLRLRLDRGKLSAPFDGTVSWVCETEGAHVARHQTVATLQARHDTSVVCAETKADLSTLTFLASPAQNPGLYCEVSASPTPNGITFESKDGNLSSLADGTTVKIYGYNSTSISPECRHRRGQEELQLPYSAIVADAAGRPCVWIVDFNTRTVTTRLVTIGHVYGDQIAVLSGLEERDCVVVGGVDKLHSGVIVRIVSDDAAFIPQSEDPMQQHVPTHPA
jgi:hypothetical protein